jgi:leader peptidase (prepilin peptidase)/N-methyltransferase
VLVRCRYGARMGASVLAVLPATVAGVAAGPWIRTHVYSYAPPPALVRCCCVGAATLGVLALRVADPWTLVAYTWVVVVGVALGHVDAAVRRLPDRLTLVLYGGLLVLFVLDERWPTFGRAVLGGLAMAGFYAALVLLNPGGMGPGDVKLALGLGTALGWLGWWPVFLGTLLAFTLSAAYGILTRRREPFAHGPSMLIGALLAVVLVGG